MRRPIALVALTLLVVASPALASDDSVGRAISQCFHPFSDYVDTIWGETTEKGVTKSRAGILKYRPLNNKVYRMPFVFQLRVVDGEKEWRVVPDDEADTGPMGPNPKCEMRHWRVLKD